MKKLLVFVAAASLMSCSLLQKSTTASSSNTTSTAATTPAPTATVAATPTSAGNAAGQALLALYNQYKADGKYDYKNINNISNLLLLLANTTDLPSNVKNSAYLKEFGQGMMMSAANLITPANVESVTGNLTTLASQYAEKAQGTVAQTADKAANTVSSAAEKLNTAAQTASSVASLLSMFK